MHGVRSTNELALVWFKTAQTVRANVVRNRVSCLIAIPLFAFGLCVCGEATEPAESLPSDEPAVERKRTTELNGRELKRWDFSSRQHGALNLSEKPAMRWSHFDVGRYYGDVYVVTARERPVAIFGMFRWFHPTTNTYVFATALDDSGIVARRDGEKLWQPRTSSLEWKALPDANRPGRSKATRLLQMRKYARSFSGEVSMRPVADRTTFRKLRLLPQPIYRYSTKTTDGAIFAFAEGTNPAVLLCLEADLTSESTNWRYGYARRWTFESRMRHEKGGRWKVPTVQPKLTSTDPFYVSLIPE